MKKQVFFVHSAGEQGKNQGSGGLSAYLADALGSEYNFIFPKFPNPEFPQYELWKAKLDQELAGLEGEVIVIGHSLGGSVLIKYLSEEAYNPSIIGLFLIAAPYWGKDDRDWQNNEYILTENFASKLSQNAKMFFYHSFYDKIVPHTHLSRYKEKLPKAAVRVLSGDDHFFNKGLPELIDDIKSL